MCFVVDKVALAPGFSPSPSVAPCKCNSTNAPHSCLSTYCSYQKHKRNLRKRNVLSELRRELDRQVISFFFFLQTVGYLSLPTHFQIASLSNCHFYRTSAICERQISKHRQYHLFIRRSSNAAFLLRLLFWGEARSHCYRTRPQWTTVVRC